MDKKKVYICHPLAGNVEENVKKVNKIARFIAIVERHIPVVPHHIAFYLNDVCKNERELGISIALDMLLHSDELWICGFEKTSGMIAEIYFAEDHNIKINLLTEKEINEMLNYQYINKRLAQ